MHHVQHSPHAVHQNEQDAFCVLFVVQHGLDACTNSHRQVSLMKPCGATQPLCLNVWG